VLKKVPKASSDKNVASKVLTEFNILTKLKHPRIVQLIFFYQSKTSWNFILEYMQFGSLRHLMDNLISEKWKLGQKDLLHLFMDIVSGLRYLHINFFSHRDIKPENILVDTKNRLKIADFGISKTVQGSNSLYHTTQIGTLSYMAPEIWIGKPYDKSCDMWALGIVFFEMAMLKYPWTPQEKGSILNESVQFIPPKIDFVRRNYAPGCQQLLEMMIQRSPSKRATILEVCQQPLVADIHRELLEEELAYFNQR